jgi:aspartate racemase
VIPSVRRLAIPRTGVLAGAPLSFAQQRLWFLDQLTPDSSIYNIPLIVDLEGPLDVEAMCLAIREIVCRHDVLRTTFPSHRGIPHQVVQSPDAFLVPVDDLSRCDVESRNVEVDAAITEEARRPFDLAQGPIFRMRLLRLGREQHVLVGAVHHLVFDAWSTGIFFRELTTLYRAFSTGHPSPLPDLPVRYVDFASWQRDYLQGEHLRRELDYWKEHLKVPPRLAWPTDLRRPARQSFQGARAHLMLPEDLMGGVEAFSRREGVTLYITLLSAFAILLHRFCGQDEMVIGVPIANRTRQELEPLIGFFLNTLPLRLDVSGEPTFRGLLQRIKRVAFSAYAHQELPFEKLVEELRPERSLSHSPLIDTAFVLDNNPGGVYATQTAGDLRLRRRVIDTGTAKFDLAMMLFRRDGGRRATIEYSRDLFEPQTASRLLDHYRRLLEGIVSNPDRSIAELPLSSDDERAIITTEWSGSTAPYPRDKTLAELFEAEVRRAPDAPAVVASGNTLCSELTYDALNRQANQLAHHLRARGVKANDRIGVLLERSPDVVVALLAIVKAGAAYVPLDPSYPLDRIASLIHRAGVRIVVTRDALAQEMALNAGLVVRIDTDADAIANESTERIPNPKSMIQEFPNRESPIPNPESLVYTLFTSGSTGTPKEVGVPHRAIVRLAYGMPDVPLGPGARVLHMSALSFDLSTLEIWGPLLRGGCVVIAPNKLHTPVELEELLTSQRVTVLWLTASLFNVVIDEHPRALASVRYVITGGETLSVSHVERALAVLPDTVLINGYGPTEATTFATYHVIARDGRPRTSIPIGRPLANTRVYVLDHHGEPVPAGYPGELWIGGDALSRGYLNDAALTAERFRPDPFAGPRARMYKSGDRARFLSDGCLEFLGRADDQIKMRGFRIEPGEIEAALMAHPLVDRAAVAAHELAASGRSLVAYVVGRDAGSAPSTAELRAFLRSRLPEHMVPQFYEQLDALPLLPSGKTDRRALKAPSLKRSATSAVATDGTVSSTEAAVAGVWRELLKVERIDRDSNFFESGGDSLLAAQAVSRLGSTMGAPLAVRSLFEFPTVAGLAKLLDEHRRAPSTQGSGIRDRGSRANPGAGNRVPFSKGPEPRTPDPRSPIPDPFVPSSAARAAALVPGEIESTLAEIWRNILGVASVDIDDDFFELGGHSLLAVRLSSELESRFGIAVPIATLFQHGTIRAQARLVAQPGQATEWSPIVAIQPSGTRPPFFLVHAIGGEVLSYASLAAHLGKDQPVYGIRARLEEGARFFSSVEEMATTYVRGIRRMFPSGPYRLGGYSGGGLIAFEIAQQLRAAGEEVSLLAMIDCSAPGGARRGRVWPTALFHLLRNAAYWMVDDDFLNAGLGAASGRLRSKAIMWRARLRSALLRGAPEDVDVRHALGLWHYPDNARDFLEAFHRALTTYQPRPYDGTVTVIRSRTRRLVAFAPMNPDLGWLRLASGGVQTRLVPGAHDTIIREPRVRKLADVLSQSLHEVSWPA